MDNRIQLLRKLLDFDIVTCEKDNGETATLDKNNFRILVDSLEQDLQNLDNYTEKLYKIKNLIDAYADKKDGGLYMSGDDLSKLGKKVVYMFYKERE